MNTQNRKYFSRAQELIDEGVPFASVSLVHLRGHAPQEMGAKILVSPDGLLEGTIGGGKVEAKAIALAREMLESGSSSAPHEFVTWNLQRDVGMTCGGEVSLFFEAFFCNEWEIAVFGAGHVAQALIRLLLTLDCNVTCVDNRSEWLDRLPESPRLKKIFAEEMRTEVVKLPAQAFIMLMTQGHKFDVPILKEVLSTRTPPYLGVIGSKVKAVVLRKELAESGFSSDQIERLHCPMGLPLGDSSPAEIAVSMVAQIIQVRDRLFITS